MMTSYYCFIVAIFLSVSFVASDIRLDGGDELGWDTSRWRVQVDGVMGGRSSGFLEFDDSDTTMAFTGDININGGGFAGVRRYFNVINMSEYAGIVVELETIDGYNAEDVKAPLGLHLQLGSAGSYWGFASAFAIPASNSSGVETSVFIPLDSFDRGGRAGYRCNNCKLDTSSVNNMYIYVLFQKGDFNIRVKSITAVVKATSFPSPVIPVTSSNKIREIIKSTLSAGSSVYNYGYQELCISIYSSTLNTLLASSGDAMSDTLKGFVCEGLARAGSQSSKVDIAWTLRYTMDAILEELEYVRPYYGSAWRPTGTNTTNLCSGVTSFPAVAN